MPIAQPPPNSITDYIIIPPIYAFFQTTGITVLN